MPTIDDLQTDNVLDGNEGIADWVTATGTRKITIRTILGMLAGTVAGIDLSKQQVTPTGLNPGTLAALLGGTSPIALATGSKGDASALTVTPAGATTALSLADIIGWQNSVYSFGAKGDGTTNDLTAINAAQTQASTTTGVLFYPPGSYNFGGSTSASEANPIMSLGFNAVWPDGSPYGSTDGSALGNGAAHAAGLSIIKALPDDYNEHIFVVQGSSEAEAGTTSYQKNGIYVNVSQNAVSDAAGATPYTKDLVALAGFGTIGGGNTQGRVWGGNFSVTCPSGAQGSLNGVEVDVTNNSGTDAVINLGANPNNKTGLAAVGMGSNKNGAAFIASSLATTNQWLAGFMTSAEWVSEYAFLHTASDGVTPLTYITAGGALTVGSSITAAAGIATSSGDILTDSGNVLALGGIMGGDGSLASFTSTALENGGYALSWNYTNGSAETDIVNFRPSGIGNGGIVFYDQQAGSSPVALASLNATGAGTNPVLFSQARSASTTNTVTDKLEVTVGGTTLYLLASTSAA